MTEVLEETEEIPVPSLFGDIEWYDVPSRTTVQNGWSVLVLDNGRKILTFGGKHQAGSHVSILDSDDREICAWNVAEWEAEGEGESVMGLMLRLAGGEELNGPFVWPKERAGR